MRADKTNKVCLYSVCLSVYIYIFLLPLHNGLLLLFVWIYLLISSFLSHMLNLISVLFLTYLQP